MFNAGIYIFGGTIAKADDGFKKEANVARATKIKQTTANFSRAGALAPK